MMAFLCWSRCTSKSKVDLESGAGTAGENQNQGSGGAASRSRKWGCCGGGGEKEKEVDEQKEAYKKLIEDLDWAEESSVNLFNGAWVLTEFIVISGLAAAMACTLTLDPMKHQRLFGLRMWQYVLLATTLFAGLSVIRFITKAVFWSVLRWRWMHRDLGYFLRAMKTSVDVTLWLSTVLFAWYVWFRPRLKHVYGDVSVVLSHQATRFRILIAVCLGSVLWVAKNILFFWLEADLHYRQLCGHITRTICQLHVLQILHWIGVWKFLNHPHNRKRLRQILLDRRAKDEDGSQAKVDQLETEGRNICRELLLVQKDNVPVWILRRLCEEYMDQIHTRPLPVTKQIIQNPENLMDQALKLFSQMKRANQPPTRRNNSSECESDDDEVKLADLEGRYKVDRKDLELFIERINPHEKSDNIDGGVCNTPCQYFGDKNKKEVKEEPEIGRDEFCS